MPKSTIYKLRRADAELRSAWFDALCEAYDNLEISLLYRLRMGELEGSKTRSRRKYDNATAFRLLAAHRDAASHQKALRSHEDEDAALASCERKTGCDAGAGKAAQQLIIHDKASDIAH